MQQRVISAAVLVPVVIIVFLLGPPWLTMGIALLAAVAAYETSQLATKAGLYAPIWYGVVVAPSATLGLAWLLEPEHNPLALALVAPAVAVVIFIAAVIAFRQQDPRTGLHSWAGTTLSALYPSMLAFLAAFVGVNAAPQTDSMFGLHMDQGRIFLLILVLVVWTLDSGAYLSGRTFGRRKMAPHISPNKTWEGSIGGTIAAIVVSAALFAGTGFGPLIGMVLGLVIAVAAQAGDLAESVLKRAAGEKDSGRLIPGHGGILDRVDSFLFAGPAMYFAFALYGVVLGTNP